MIINTGMRTDIPAFFSEWLINRLKEGYVYTRNPYNPNAVTKYRLSPDIVDVIVFCTKNPKPMFAHLDLLKPYGQYWFVTITPYGKDIEPHVPSKENVMEDLKRLSAEVGTDSVAWRYDPILITETYTVEQHIAEFEQMANELAGYTNTCIISFIDLYEKVKRNFPEVREVTFSERIQLAKEFVQIGKKYGMEIRSCAEGEELRPYGVNCSGCMTVETFEKAIRGKLCVPKRKSQRPECACVLGNDIGQYDTCGHLCRYCYANTRADIVRDNMRRHDPKSPFLVGHLMEEDVIHEAKQQRWRDDQISLFW